MVHGSPQRVLYQFPISHYCEKARWALEHKGLEYSIKNLVPGPHLATVRKLAPRTYTPILVDGETVVQGSDGIIDYLDKQHKHAPLTPTTSHDASLAHEWERYADKHIGIPLRLYFYFHVLRDRKLATRLLTRDGPWWGGLLYFFAYPGIRNAMRKAMSIDEQRAESARKAILVALDHVAQKTKDKRFLAGPTFSRADLSVSALLAPTWTMSEQPPQELAEFIEQISSHEALRWAEAIYAQYRTPSG